ncbi:MAG: triphosphoribosyl-dephospho-CoA synthase CitG [Lachnospiraceae bacterium]
MKSSSAYQSLYQMEKQETVFWKLVRQNIEAALLGEVFTTPKPGLVDCHDSGAHKDMDCNTFIKSTYAISPYLTQMVYAGYHWRDSAENDMESLFPFIRQIGIQAEKAMFRATEGVNTHKGIIFTMGILGAAAGYDFHRKGYLDISDVLAVAGEMVYEEMENEFAAMKKQIPKTHGEILFHRYGEKGIRGEAQNGFPIIRDISWPWMMNYMQSGLNSNAAKINVLLQIMVHLNDTNILSRSNYMEMEWIKRQAAYVLEVGGAGTEKGWKELTQMNQECIRKNISPGGAADILAATLFLFLMEETFRWNGFKNYSTI